jgi:hypothetical protein
MAKELKTAAELDAMLNAELRKHAVCDHIQAFVRRAPIDTADANWELGILRGSGTPPTPDCWLIANAAVLRLRRDYDLKD